jgi:hypothetical protein
LTLKDYLNKVSGRGAGMENQDEKKPGTVEQRVLDVAEGMGRLLGEAEARLQSWINQREQVVKDLLEIRDRASSLLDKAGYQAQEVVTEVRRQGKAAATVAKAAMAKAAEGRRRGRPPGSGKGTGGGGMSEEGRARVAAAQKARWAAKKTGESQPPETDQSTDE